MNDAATFIALAAVVVAIWQCYIARNASKAAKQSAGAALASAQAADKSAHEAEKSGKIARTNLLRPYFDSIDHIWNFGIDRDPSKVAVAKTSIEQLKYMLSNDQQLCEVLDKMLVMEPAAKSEKLYSPDVANDKINNRDDLRERFNNKKREYLNLG